MPSFAASLTKSVTVQGTGKVEAAPNIAVVRLGISQDGLTIPPLEKAVRDQMNAVLESLKANGVSAQDIQTQSFQVFPKMEWNANTGSHRVGYTVSNQLKVTVRNLDSLGSVLSSALSAGANQVSGPEFDVENRTKFEAAALAGAMRDARIKAAALAESAGAALGPVLTISENTASFPVRPMMAAMAAATPAEPIQTGQETITASVTVTFALVPSR